MRSAFLLLFTLIAMLSRAAGELQEFSLVKHFSADEMKQFFDELRIPRMFLGAKDGVAVYEIIYTTTYADSTPVLASGLLYVPLQLNRPLPTLIYNHGTQICRDRVFNGRDEQTICLGFATDGYLVLCPDYVGMGKGERTHLYLNAFTEAHASVDMLISVDTLLPKLGAARSKELFLSGYSQGGHASMATHKLLQEEYHDRFPVTAASPMSGPYDIHQTVYGERYKSYRYPGYLMMLLQSFVESHHSMLKMQEILRAPYNQNIPPLMNGAWPMNVIDAYLPDTAFRCVTDNFLKEFETDEQSPFRRYLKENNVFDWKPEAPTQLCFCDGDKQVTYKNSITAFQTMRRNGSDKVELMRAGKKFDHFNCALFAIMYTKMYFDGFRQGHPGSHGPYFQRLVLRMGRLIHKK
ncbi:MAG: lipase family protein [Chitinophagales bacterium]